jgi:hypothetical protein
MSKLNSSSGEDDDDDDRCAYHGNVGHVVTRETRLDLTWLVSIKGTQQEWDEDEDDDDNG